MRKILIATPLRGDLPPQYFHTLFKMMTQRIEGIKFGYAFVSGTSIQWARDEAIKMARDQNCTEIIFWDKDLIPSVQDFIRLINHKEDLVCALYSKREYPTTWHAMGIKTEEPQENGLLSVFQAAIGFSKIKMDVFDRIKAKFPERQYLIKNAGSETVHLFEYFPMERFGPNTAQGKLDRLNKLDTSMDAGAYSAMVASILQDNDYSANAMLGEDYSFCRLARESGTKIYLDTELIVGHNGEVTFPIPTKDLQDMLTEVWRQDEIANNKQ